MIAEHNNEKLGPITLSAVTAAKKLGNDDISILVAGSNVSKVAEEAAKVANIKRVIIADSDVLKTQLPGKYRSSCILKMLKNYDFVGKMVIFVRKMGKLWSFLMKNHNSKESKS